MLTLMHHEIFVMKMVINVVQKKVYTWQTSGVSSNYYANQTI